MIPILIIIVAVILEMWEPLAWQGPVVFPRAQQVARLGAEPRSPDSSH